METTPRATAHPATVFVLSIVTIGAYAIYWHYRTNEILRDHGQPVRPALSGLAVSWGALLVVPALVSCATTALRVRRACLAAKVPAPNVAAALLLLIVAGYAPYLQTYMRVLTGVTGAT
ncbi:MAG TPA: DUF4234 domain-containing protein [Actinomycetota bacterium]|nr:DUF4234 domain-containing protein [Actinomycetota bacterium]